MILIDDLSDHLPSLVLMKQTKLRNKDPLCFNSRSLTADKIEQIRNDLKTKDWIGMLINEDVNKNLDKFSEELESSMNKYAPNKEIRISWKRKFTEPWMNKSVEKASEKCRKLYKKSITMEATDEDRIHYKQYRANYNKITRNVRNECYSSKCKEYGRNTKQLWRLINGIITKKKHTGNVIPFISIKGIKTYNPHKIANEFGRYYASMGAELARYPKVISTYRIM